jgi:hypothetical protein
MMERADDTSKKRCHQVIIYNEEAVQPHKQEIHRQGYRNYTNTDQSGNVSYLYLYSRKIQREARRPDLQVPIDNSSTHQESSQQTRIDLSSMHTHEDYYTRIKDT